MHMVFYFWLIILEEWGSFFTLSLFSFRYHCLVKEVLMMLSWILIMIIDRSCSHLNRLHILRSDEA